LVESKPDKPEEKPKQSKAAAAAALELWEKEIVKTDREVSSRARLRQSYSEMKI